MGASKDRLPSNSCKYTAQEAPTSLLYHKGSSCLQPGNAALPNIEGEGKELDGRYAVMINQSEGEHGKEASCLGNDGALQRDGLACDGPSEVNDNANQEASPVTKKRGFNQMLTDGAKTKIDNASHYNGKNHLALVSQGNAMPVINSNMGMDIWNASSAEATSMKALPTDVFGGSKPVASVTATGCENHQKDEWEQKREKRKQLNRESARRSRLRKQAECEELQARVEKLSNETRTLGEELRRLAEECGKLKSENNSLMEELTHLCGPDAISKLRGQNCKTAFHSIDGGNISGQDGSTENSSPSSSSQN